MSTWIRVISKMIEGMIVGFMIDIVCVGGISLS